jgi:hypothetical protein
MTKLRPLVALVAVLALALVSCGGDDDDDDVGADASGSVDIDPDDLEDAAELAGIDEDCLVAVQAFGYIGAAAGVLGDDDALAEYREAFEDWADNAPSEIEGDVRVVAEAYEVYFAAMAESGYDMSSGEAPTAEQQAAMEEAGAAIDSDEVQAAQDNVSAWLDENCDAAGG